MTDPVLTAAQKRVQKKKQFYKHLAAFIGVGFFFFAINLATIADGDRELWFFFPMLPWSVGLIIHYLTTFGFPGTGILTPEWEEKQLEKEIRDIRKKTGYVPRRQDELELKELSKEKEDNWESEDFV
ncbi:MAG TPA: 2TM domain-containing protein [Saprospiraceae bacterium]|nr:2TM domain-containing protein [Saprospiraceae bacterium]